MIGVSVRNVKTSMDVEMPLRELVEHYEATLANGTLNGMIIVALHLIKV